MEKLSLFSPVHETMSTHVFTRPTFLLRSRICLFILEIHGRPVHSARERPGHSGMLRGTAKRDTRSYRTCVAVSLVVVCQTTMSGERGGGRGGPPLCQPCSKCIYVLLICYAMYERCLTTTQLPNKTGSKTSSNEPPPHGPLTPQSAPHTHILNNSLTLHTHSPSPSSLSHSHPHRLHRCCFLTPKHHLISYHARFSQDPSLS